MMSCFNETMQVLKWMQVFSLSKYHQHGGRRRRQAAIHSGLIGIHSTARSPLGEP